MTARPSDAAVAAAFWDSQNEWFKSQGESQAWIEASARVLDACLAADKSFTAEGAPLAQQPLHDSANITGVAAGSRNESASESVTQGSLPPPITTPPPAAAPYGWVAVPREPTQGVLVSMAIRYDHALGCPGYYDGQVFGANGGGHQKRMDSTINKMRQLYEEVVGDGFHSPDREKHYVAINAALRADSDGGG